MTFISGITRPAVRWSWLSWTLSDYAFSMRISNLWAIFTFYLSPLWYIFIAEPLISSSMSGKWFLSNSFAHVSWIHALIYCSFMASANESLMHLLALQSSITEFSIALGLGISFWCSGFEQFRWTKRSGETSFKCGAPAHGVKAYFRHEMLLILDSIVLHKDIAEHNHSFTQVKTVALIRSVSRIWENILHKRQTLPFSLIILCPLRWFRIQLNFTLPFWIWSIVALRDRTCVPVCWWCHQNTILLFVTPWEPHSITFKRIGWTPLQWTSLLSWIVA